MKRAPSYPALLLITYGLIWAALAIHPKYRGDWWLENALVFVAVPLLGFYYRRLRFSNLAYTCLFAFFVLHSIGSHYTYAEVPYDRWLRSLLGFSLNDALGFSRNQFDRLVHFLYGALMLPAVVELLEVKAPPRGIGWRIALPILFITSHSVIYETIEWLAAEVFGGDLGQAYLGTQGDEWDSQKDMALATLGACCTMLMVEIARRRGWRPKKPGPA